MALTSAQLEQIRNWLARADARLNGAAAAAARPHPTEGEFDNNFDGVVTAIFHTVDAYELAVSGIHRRVSETETSTRITAAVRALTAAGVPGVPSYLRLTDLNHRRNTSVHGDWLEVLDPEALQDAILATRQLWLAVIAHLRQNGIAL